MFTFGDKQCVDPAKLYDDCAAGGLPTDLFAGKANTFRVNAGATPSGGAVLLTRKDFVSLDMTKGHALTISDGRSGGRLTFMNLFVVDGVRVVGGASGDNEAVYLVTIADNRFRLARIPIDKAYNVRPADGGSYLSATLNAGVSWSWSGMLGNLWAAVGSLGTYPGLGVIPDGTPENLQFWGGYALDALCRMLNRVGFELHHDNTTDTYSVKRMGAGGTSATYFASWLKAEPKFDGQCYFPNATNRPEKVRVRFRVMPTPTDGTSPYYFVDVALTAAAGVLSGSMVVLDDDLAALGVPPSNTLGLSSRATERAADYQRKWDNFDQPTAIQYREYLPAARTSVGERKAAVIYEDVGDGHTTEAFSKPNDALERPLPLNVYGETGGDLNSQNTDGTEIDATTTDLRFTKSTGVQVTQGSGGTAGQSLVTLIAATPSQMGAVTTATQIFEGEKRFNAPIARTENTSTAASGATLLPEVRLDVGTTATVAAHVVDTANPGTIGDPRSSFYVKAANGAVSARFYPNTDGTNPPGGTYGPEVTIDSVSNGGKYSNVTVAMYGFTTLYGAVSLWAYGLYGGGANTRMELQFSTNQALYVETSNGSTSTTGSIRINTNLEFDAAGYGPIVRSPDGNKWRLGVDNAGALTITGPL